VVKCGGAALAGDPFELGRWLEPGSRGLVVHGAGPRISAALRAEGIESTFRNGRRVTTAEAMPVVREALRQENAALCCRIGSRAVPLMGDELGLEAEQVEELGLVGMPVAAAPPRLRTLLETGAVPVVAPLASGPLNVNADDAAAALAVGLRAERLAFVSDVAGVLIDGEPAASLDARDLDRHADELSGGVLPKVEAALRAARAGIRVTIGETRIVP
jgi:acetylglutamate kinase